MTRNTQHLAPSNRYTRMKQYSGRSGASAVDNQYATRTPLSGSSTKVRSGANSQKEYIGTSGVDSMSTQGVGMTQAKLDKIRAKRKKNKSK